MIPRRRRLLIAGLAAVLCAGLATAITFKWKAAVGVWGDPTQPAAYNVKYGNPAHWHLQVQRSAVSGTSFTCTATLTWNTNVEPGQLYYFALQYAVNSNGDGKIEPTEWRTAARGDIVESGGVITATIQSTTLSTTNDGWAVFIDDSVSGSGRHESAVKPGLTVTDWP